MKNKKCNHNFKHKVIKGETYQGDTNDWIIHKCSKCGIESEAVILRDKEYNKWKEVHDKEFEKLKQETNYL